MLKIYLLFEESTSCIFSAFSLGSRWVGRGGERAAEERVEGGWFLASAHHFQGAVTLTRKINAVSCLLKSYPRSAFKETASL